jgi:hypothetical protein
MAECQLVFVVLAWRQQVDDAAVMGRTSDGGGGDTVGLA